MKHVQYFLDSANDATRTAKYSPVLGSQESAVFHYGTDANADVGSVWFAPNQVCIAALLGTVSGLHHEDLRGAPSSALKLPLVV